MSTSRDLEVAPLEKMIFCFGCGERLQPEEIFMGTGCSCEGVSGWSVFSETLDTVLTFFPKNWVVTDSTCSLAMLNFTQDKRVYSIKA